MSQADNYTPQEVEGTTATLDVVLPWVFDGIDELEITQTDGVTIVSLDNNDFDAFVVGQIVTVENFYGDGNLTTITVARDTKQTQEFTQSESNPLDSAALNAALDKIVRMIQDTSFKSDFVFDSLTDGELRDLLLTAITSDDPFDIPAKDNRKSVWMGFDEEGQLFLGVPDNVAPPGGPVNPEDFLTVLTDIKVVTGTSYTLIDSDSGKFIIFTNVADVTVTSPADLTLGHQVMYLKTAPDNETIHVADVGAEHVNDIPVIASKQHAWYSHVVFENTGGTAAKYRFIGEIDAVDVDNIESVSRTITITNGTSGPNAQAQIDAAGKYLDKGVELKIVFEDTTLILTAALVISDFTGPGILTVESLTPAPQDTATLRPVNITNSNIPSILEYADPVDYDNQLNWDAYLANSCMVISGNTCSQVSIRGFSFSSKVFPVVMTANTATMDIRFNFFNQINAFTLSEYDVAAGLKINGGMAYTFQNKYTTDTDTNGLLLHGCQVHLSEPAGAGGHLAVGGSGVAVAYDTGAFTFSVALHDVDGFWSTDGQIDSSNQVPQATELILGGGKIATNGVALGKTNDTDIMTALKTAALIAQELAAFGLRTDTYLIATVAVGIPTTDLSNNLSIVRDAKGQFTATFGVAMPDTDYATSILVGSEGASERAVCYEDVTKTTAGFSFFVSGVGDGAAQDPSYIDIKVSREL